MVVLIIVTLYLIFPWGALWLGLWLQPAPEEPVCKYGEFPFTLQYEINGEIKTISNTLVCKYKGIGIDEASGKKRLWEASIANGDTDKIVLLKINELAEIYYSPGPAAYYMGDYKNDYSSDFPNAKYLKYNENGSGRQEGIVFADELYNKYKIKILKWDSASPIQNAFK